ncbi:MAG TPA: hypothetical protein VE621_01630 [Bryobacteraceae bacterium]|nr:hypothetical protein [Bryobacteraceae bacterium]
MGLQPDQQRAAEQFASWLGEKSDLSVSWKPVSPNLPDVRFTVELEGRSGAFGRHGGLNYCRISGRTRQDLPYPPMAAK